MTSREQIENCIANPATSAQAHHALNDLLAREPTLKNYQFAYRMLDGRRLDRHIRLALLTSYTSDFVIPLLGAELMRSGISVEFYKSQYNQFRQEILNPEGGLYQFAPRVTLAGFNLEDVFPGPVAHFSVLTDRERRSLFDEVLGLYQTISESFQKYSSRESLLLIQDLIAPFGAYDSVIRTDTGIHAFVDSINRELRSVFGGRTAVRLLDFSRLVSDRGRRLWTDPRIYYSARIPVAQTHWIELAAYYASHVRAALSLEVKCVVLDLDNTLWGGVLGEDGFDNIELGETYPGNVFKRFQEYLLGLNANGYALALSSKNNVDDVMAVLRGHPGMVLRENHFAAIKANWDAKAENIRQISKELQILPDHMLFVDDNPVEIAGVSAAIPEMQCLHLPSPPLDFVERFEAQRCFGRLLTTDEDRHRGRQYFEERQRREFKQSTLSLDDFYRSLAQRLTVYVNCDQHVARIAQLTQRTNQFNMTTIRLTEAEVAAMIRRPDLMLITADLRDRFGDNGTIAYLQIRKLDRSWVIENWLMSCRVLGRTVEGSLLDHVVSRAREAQLETLFASYVPTTKNAPFADFYPKNGFTENGSGTEGEKRFALPLAAAGQRESFVEVLEA